MCKTIYIHIYIWLYNIIWFTTWACSRRKSHQKKRHQPLYLVGWIIISWQYSWKWWEYFCFSCFLLPTIANDPFMRCVKTSWSSITDAPSGQPMFPWKREKPGNQIFVSHEKWSKIIIIIIIWQHKNKRHRCVLHGWVCYAWHGAARLIHCQHNRHAGANDGKLLSAVMMKTMSEIETRGVIDVRNQTGGNGKS